MSNASTTARTSRKRKVAHTSAVVPMVAWQQPGPITIKHARQQEMLKRTLRSSAHHARPVSIGVHGAKCSLAIFVLPLMSDVDDFVALNDCIADRDEQCTCSPVIMYTGARA